jgi:uncharacterized protein with von Willebrand factor type A (vWA) domain
VDARIAELASLLRARGVRVSPAEVADAVRAAALAGVEDRATLRSALRATLVKRARDVPVFEALFALWAGALGRALRAFHVGFLSAVTRRTTVLVVADGRNNHNPPEAWVLDEVRRRARRLLWICPEDRASWGTGDSEMDRYAARCDRVATAATLEELEEIAEQLVPRR